jgi:hypothetical protein
VPEGKKILETVAAASNGALSFEWSDLDAGWVRAQSDHSSIPST